MLKIKIDETPIRFIYTCLISNLWYIGFMYVKYSSDVLTKRKSIHSMAWLIFDEDMLDPFVNCDDKWMSLWRQLGRATTRWGRDKYDSSTSKTNTTLTTNVISMRLLEETLFFFLKSKVIVIDKLWTVAIQMNQPSKIN